MALIRTDYGLIYNTDGSLCATLLPEGGVAVDEATENLVPDGDVEKTGSAIISYALDVATFKQLEGKVLTVSIDAIDKYDGKHVIDIYLRREDAEGGVVEGTRSSPIHVTSEYRRVSYTFTLPELGTITKLYLYIRGNTYVPGGGDNTGTYTVKNAQIENKPYDTAFVKGSRSWGALDIPTNLSLLQSGTIAFKCWTPKAMEHRLDYYDGAVINVCQGDVRQLDLGMGKGGFNFCVYSETVSRLIPYEPNTEYFVVITWEDGGNPKFYLNGDLIRSVAETFTDPGNGIIQLGRQITTRVNTIRFKDLLICPYAVSPETIATWHSLDAPFFDPREQIDAGARPIYAPGVQIDSTGAWGISNGVKQAGFGTDGKLVAGGGSVVADADGLIGKDPDTDEVKFKIGTNGKVEVLEIYSDMYKEIRNVLPYNYLDSLDADNPLICDFYIPSETENIVSVKLSAKGLPFRAYAKGSRSGGAIVETSAFGGSHTHSLHNVELSTEGYHDHGGSTSTTGSHNHSISSSLTSTSKDNLSGVSSAIKRTSAEGTPGEPVGLHSHSIGDFDGASISGHTHDYYKADSTSSTGDHKHTISGDGRHTHTISSFSLVEGGSHTHKITIPGHTHDLIFGIYEDTSPANVVLWIDNGSGFNTSINLGSNEILAEELDITQYVTGTGWKRLKFTSSRLGRINAQLIVKVDLTA